MTAGQATLEGGGQRGDARLGGDGGHTHYILGSALGSHPFPMMVRDFHRVIGVEAREQILEKEGRLPDLLVACVGGGSNAIGLFHPFLDDEDVRMVGVEAGGDGIIPERHAARFQGGKLGRAAGDARPGCWPNDDGQIELTHSVSAGLDYAAIGPEHAYLQDLGRVEYTYATDDRGAGGLPGTGGDGGDPAGAGERPRRWPTSRRSRREPAEGRNPDRQSVRPRRQGRRAGGEVSAGEVGAASFLPLPPIGVLFPVFAVFGRRGPAADLGGEWREGLARRSCSSISCLRPALRAMVMTMVSTMPKAKARRATIVSAMPSEAEMARIGTRAGVVMTVNR